jgi:mRNA interferase RelE/StbE
VADVQLSRRAVKDLDALPDKTARRVLDALETLAADPNGAGLDVKPLVGRRPWRRLRVGNHRVLFRVGANGQVVLVARVVDRKELEQAVLSLPG